jgi:hypothetical protein
MRLLTTLPLVLVPLAAGRPQDPPPEAPPEAPAEAVKPYKIGSTVERLSFRDLAGRERDLFAEAEERVIVLVWWALRDPLAHAYEERLTALRDDFRERGVLLFLVDSSYDEIAPRPGAKPLERIAQYVAERRLSLPILVDPDNAIADDFGALCSNHAFVIDERRFVRYFGGIDDDPGGARERAGATVDPWLRNALVELLEGRSPTVPLTRPKGRKLVRTPE